MKFLNSVVRHMKANKKFEMLVYGILAAMGIILYLSFSTGSNDNGGASNIYDHQESTVMTQTEVKLENILSTIDGAGKVKVMISTAEKEGVQTISGVIVTASGAKDISLQLKLHDAVCTVLGIESDMVEVFEMREDNENEKQR